MKTLSGASRGAKCALVAAVVGISGALAVPAVAAEEGFDRGEALYENHCRSCHESWVHTREGHRVQNIADIRSRVTAWSVHSGLNWSPEEIDDVSRFLAERYYKLEERD